jgi:hypothetical protein
MTQGLLGSCSGTNMYMCCIEGMQFTLFTQVFFPRWVVEAHVSLWLVNILIFSLKSAKANGTKRWSLGKGRFRFIQIKLILHCGFQRWSLQENIFSGQDVITDVRNTELLKYIRENSGPKLNVQFSEGLVLGSSTVLARGPIKISKTRTRNVQLKRPHTCSTWLSGYQF